MSQRCSGYERRANDLYETPSWVTEALIPHLPQGIVSVLEPACGSGKMVAALKRHFRVVCGKDIKEGYNFLRPHDYSWALFDAVITNPPFNLARQFIETALGMQASVVAMLLRTDYDHARTRKHLFADCPAFSKKVVLTRRIVWFERPGAAPSFNHAWFIWSWAHNGAPTLAYV